LENSFRDFIKKSCEDVEMTQSQLAAEMSITKTHLYKKLGLVGGAKLTLDDILKMSDILSIPSTKIFEQFLKFKGDVKNGK
jgi:hypothetical protein